MNYIIQAFKALEEIDDDVVVVKPKQKRALKESAENYYVLSDGKNPRHSQVITSIDDLDAFIKDLEANKCDAYCDLIHYVNGNPKKVWDSKAGRVEEACKLKEGYVDDLYDFAEISDSCHKFFTDSYYNILNNTSGKLNKKYYDLDTPSTDNLIHDFIENDVDCAKELYNAYKDAIQDAIKKEPKYFGKDTDKVLSIFGLKESCSTKEDLKVELHPEFDSRQSFYGKARVIIKPDGTQVLYSYGTPVCRIKDGKATLLHKGYLGWSSSQTTLRHVKEFLKQNGFEAGSINDLRKNYAQEQADISEDYDDLNDSWDSITRDIIAKVKELTGKDITDRDIHFDDSRAWSLYVPGSVLNLACNKFGAYRNYMGGGIRGQINHNGRDEDNTYELGEFFAETLKRIEDLINAGFEDEEDWDKPTGVLESKEEENKEQLNENHQVDLSDDKEVEKAKEEIEKEEQKDETEYIVDVDAETVDKLKDSYVGDVILICRKCRTPMYRHPEDIKKDETTGFYNLEDECPHCGAQDGFELGGQISEFESSEKAEEASKDEDDKKDEIDDVKVKRQVTTIEDEEDITKAESFDDSKFNKLVTKYLKEVYDNVTSFETKDGSFEDDKVILEGTIKYASNKTRDVKFVFENISRTKGNKYKLVGTNESITSDKDAFSVIATVKDGTLICETLSYNYKVNLNEEETLVRGRTSLRESKKKENKK